MKTLDKIIDDQNNPDEEKQAFKDLIHGLLRIDPNERLSLDQAFHHNFFSRRFEQEYDFLFERVDKTFDE